MVRVDTLGLRSRLMRASWHGQHAWRGSDSGAVSINTAQSCSITPRVRVRVRPDVGALRLLPCGTRLTSCPSVTVASPRGTSLTSEDPSRCPPQAGSLSCFNRPCSLCSSLPSTRSTRVLISLAGSSRYAVDPRFVGTLSRHSVPASLTIIPPLISHHP